MEHDATARLMMLQGLWHCDQWTVWMAAYRPATYGNIMHHSTAVAAAAAAVDNGDDDVSYLFVIGL